MTRLLAHAPAKARTRSDVILRTVARVAHMERWHFGRRIPTADVALQRISLTQSVGSPDTGRFCFAVISMRLNLIVIEIGHMR